MPNSGKWTEGRFNSFIKSGLRSLSCKWPPRYEALDEAFVGKRVNPKTGRLGKHYRCKHCGEVFPAKEVQVDHIDPVVPLTGFTDWDDIISRMFCEKEGLQVLCNTCHDTKTRQEKQMAKSLKDNNND